MELAEAVYRGNQQAEYFNDVLGKTLSAAIERRQKTAPGREMRIIEIGAGTGGTTSALLPMVRQYRVDEYCYTDISRAFLVHAEKQFRPRCRALTTSLFDVSKPPESQAIAGNHYDFAIFAYNQFQLITLAEFPSTIFRHIRCVPERRCHSLGNDRWRLPPTAIRPRAVAETQPPATESKPSKKLRR